MADPFVIIGAGPAGLIAADVLSATGARVVVIERMPSVGRKFLMAGRGGLNLTHSEPAERFATRYGVATARMQPMLKAFSPQDLVAWANELGQDTFIGSSGRVFPRAMKASPLLRALLARLAAHGVEIRTRTRWIGWTEGGALRLQRTDGGEETIEAVASLLALGGASWPKLGSDGGWTRQLAERGVALEALKPANVGFEIAWSAHMQRFAGEPLKAVAVRFGEHIAQGDVMITAYGVEGGAIYALSPQIRDAIARGGPQTLTLDLRPTLSHEEIAAKLSRAKASDTLSSILRKTLSLSPASVTLLREAHGAALPDALEALVALIKAAPLTLTAPRGLERAISSAGGVAWDAVGEGLDLKAVPGTYVAGEMLDWEAPTGGYLLQGCFATGVWAARAMLRQASTLAPSGPR